MAEELFTQLYESVKQMDEVANGAWSGQVKSYRIAQSAWRIAL